MLKYDGESTKRHRGLIPGVIGPETAVILPAKLDRE